MTSKKVELKWADLLKMSDEVKSTDGPGTKNWAADGSETQRVNDLFIRALRENNGKVPGELEALPGLIQKEIPRLCRGGSSSLTFPAVEFTCGQL